MQIFSQPWIMWKPSLAGEKTALGILGVHVSPVRQHERQLCQTPLQQLPQVMSHKLVALLWQVEPITQVDWVVLPEGDTRQRKLSATVLQPTGQVYFAHGKKNHYRQWIDDYRGCITPVFRSYFINKSGFLYGMGSKVKLCSPTCPSFCMSVHRSRTSEPQWPAACTHACAYCPATELRRLSGLPGKEDYI